METKIVLTNHQTDFVNGLGCHYLGEFQWVTKDTIRTAVFSFHGYDQNSSFRFSWLRSEQRFSVSVASNRIHFFISKRHFNFYDINTTFFVINLVFSVSSSSLKKYVGRAITQKSQIRLLPNKENIRTENEYIFSNLSINILRTTIAN